jgi:hypothetical protein
MPGYFQPRLTALSKKKKSYGQSTRAMSIGVARRKRGGVGRQGETWHAASLPDKSLAKHALVHRQILNLILRYCPGVML